MYKNLFDSLTSSFFMVHQAFCIDVDTQSLLKCMELSRKQKTSQC